MKRILILLVLTLMCSASAKAQQFTDFISRVYASPEQRQVYLVDSFLTASSTFPLIEKDTIAVFIYFGSGSDVFMTGDANGWSDTESPLSRLASTTLWYTIKHYEADARLDYRFIVDGKWILDPRNPRMISGGFGPNSELRMPAYISPPEIECNNTVPGGWIRDTTIHSRILGNDRAVTLYLPHGHDHAGSDFPLVLFHDGSEYLRLGRVKCILDNLIADGKIPPLVALFVPPVDRNSEYAGIKMEDYGRFVTEELLPWVDGAFRTSASPSSRAVMGASNGGNISLYLAFHYPDVFGNVAAQSSNVVESVHNDFHRSETLDLKLYLDLGTYDIPLLIPLVRDFVSVLKQKNYDYLYREYHEGHSWGFWRAHVDDALKYFFGNLVTSLREPAAHPKEQMLQNPYPNPAVSTFYAPLTLDRPAFVQLDLFDRLGRKVRSTQRVSLRSGSARIPFDVHNLPAGRYILSLRPDRVSEFKPVTILK